MKYIGESGLLRLLALIKTKIESLTAFPIRDVFEVRA